MNARFTELITQFCAESNMPEPHKMMSGTPFHIDRIAFALAHKPDVNPDLMFIYADFGLPAPENEAAVFYEMLKENFIHFSLKNASYSVSSVTGHVVYVEAFLLDTLTAAELTAILAILTKQARLWRCDYASVVPKPATSAKKSKTSRKHTQDTDSTANV